jgi:phosphatidylglycerophosphatase A
MESRRAIELSATFFYLGRTPFMPGTVGTLGAVPVVLLFSLAGTYGYMALTFFISLWAIKVADLYEQLVQDHDSKEVVIDEVVGFLVAMFWLPHTWQAFAAAFVLFRFLDILKPFPIGWLDRTSRGGFGTVVDDLVAGVIVNVVLQFAYTQTDWLGVQHVFARL